MASKKSIAIFEDDPQTASSFKKFIGKEIGNRKVSVIVFPDDKSYDEELFETRIKRDLKRPAYGDIGLIICDRDLSGTGNYRGLSEAPVTKVAEELAIPLCLYARGMSGNVVERAREWSERQIILNYKTGIDKMARRIKAIFDGFDAIRTKCKSFLNSKHKPSTPAQLMAAILGRPKLADRIALYAAGDIKNLTEVYLARKEKKEEDTALVEKRMARMLGLWLWDSILRFPGIIVNQVAVASYLNIDLRSFKTSLVTKCFTAAEYGGPFKEIDRFWWRDLLDKILADNGCKDGLALVKKLHPRSKVQECSCYVDQQSPAGYFCMIEEKPVCGSHSRANLSWFPSGADLARVSTDIYDELGPWIGLY